MDKFYWDSFKTFFRIGGFTIGGGYAMIPLIESEVVDKHRWLSRKEFLDIIAIAQSCPGVFAINMSVFIGYKMRKLPGAICSAFGTALPSFIIILLIAMFFANFQDNPVVEAIFRGVRPAVVALIAAPLFKMAKTAMKDKIMDKGQGTRDNGRKALPLLVSLAAALLIWLGHVNPVWVILTTIVITIVAVKLLKR